MFQLRNGHPLHWTKWKHLQITSLIQVNLPICLKFTVQKPWTSLSHPNCFELVRNSSLLVSSWHFMSRYNIHFSSEMVNQKINLFARQSYYLHEVQKPWTSLSHPNCFKLVRNSSLLVSSWHFSSEFNIHFNSNGQTKTILIYTFMHTWKIKQVTTIHSLQR